MILEFATSQYCPARVGDKHRLADRPDKNNRAVRHKLTKIAATPEGDLLDISKNRTSKR
jgi:hypothetical protein